MTDYVDLISRLQEVPDDWPDKKLHYEAANAIFELCIEKSSLKRDINANSITVQVPKWISINERLPDDCGRYIVYLRAFTGKDNLELFGDLSYVTEMYFDKGQMLWVDRTESYNAILEVVDTDNEYHITHWMPLPEPPKEGI